MSEQDRIRRMITLRYSPLLDMALSLLVIQNPERFGSARPWMERVAKRLPEGFLEQLGTFAHRVDLFALVLDLEESPSLSPVEALERLRAQEPEGTSLLLTYWEAISPEVAARAGLLPLSIQQELARLGQVEPLEFITHFSDRVSVSEDGESLLLQWGGGMTVPLAELRQILFVPSVFCPRRLMFYRVNSVQIFFYDPLQEEAGDTEEPPESLTLGYSALADATRLKLLRLIALQSMPAQEMARRLGVNDSTVSRHLRVLVEAGLVGRDRQEGKFIFYDLQIQRIDQLASAAKSYLRRDRT